MTRNSKERTKAMAFKRTVVVNASCDKRELIQNRERSSRCSTFEAIVSYLIISAASSERLGLHQLVVVRLRHQLNDEATRSKVVHWHLADASKESGT